MAETRPRRPRPVAPLIFGGTLGAGDRELLFRGQPVIAGYEADELPPGGAGQLLAPWPNRIDGGKYAFDSAEFQLALTEPITRTRSMA